MLSRQLPTINGRKNVRNKRTQNLLDLHDAGVCADVVDGLLLVDIAVFEDIRKGRRRHGNGHFIFWMWRSLRERRIIQEMEVDGKK